MHWDPSLRLLIDVLSLSRRVISLAALVRAPTTLCLGHLDLVLQSRLLAALVLLKHSILLIATPGQLAT